MEKRNSSIELFRNLKVLTSLCVYLCNIYMVRQFLCFNWWLVATLFKQASDSLSGYGGCAVAGEWPCGNNGVHTHVKQLARRTKV